MIEITEEDERTILSGFGEAENNHEVVELIKNLLEHGRKKKFYSQRFYQLYIAKRHAVSNKTLYIEDYLNDTQFKKNIKLLLANNLSKSIESSEYGENLITDYDLYFDKVLNHFISRDIDITPAQIKILEHNKSNQNKWLNRLVREIIDDFPWRELKKRKNQK